jgi:threonine dehydratase
MRKSSIIFSPSSTRSPTGWLINKRQTHRPVPTIATEYLARILTSQVYEAAIETPLTYAPTISAILKNELYLKREDMQPVFSFKIRGAYNKIAKLSPELRAKGVVTCSAGNHAQGVAMSASKLNINAIIVMPIATPAIKVNAVRRFGGPTVTIKLHGQNYDEAAAEAKRLELEMGLTLIHPFDDPDVIAGQGTIGMEIIKVIMNNGIQRRCSAECIHF